MKKTLIKTLLLCLLSFNAWAAAPEKISLDFRDASLLEVAQAAIKGILSRNYVIAPDLLHQNKRLTMQLNDIAPSDALGHITAILKASGIVINEKGGVLYLENISQDTAQEAQASGVPDYAQPEMFGPPQEWQPLEAEILPENIRVYKPQYRTAEFLSSVIEFTGARVMSQTADKHNVLFEADESQAEIIADLMAQLDKPGGEVLVKAHLYEVTKTEKDGSGFQMALNILSGKLGIKYGTNTQKLNTVTLALPDFTAVIDALSTDDRFKVMSSPSLRVRDGKQARFSVGSEVPVLDSVTIPQNGAPVQSVVYRNSGVILDILPTIHGESIDLDITQQLSNFVATTNGVNNSPTLIKRELLTSVTVKHNDVILLGGLDESKDNKTKFGFPFLPDWMQSKTDDRQKTDILLVLHVTRI